MSLNSTIPAAEHARDRRRFLLKLSWTGFGLFLTTFLAAVLKFFWPRVSNRPARSVQVGYPDDYQPGQVTYHRGGKFFIARDDKGFFSLSARCTHLSCMVVWNRDHQMFLCPCHGGKYDAEGRNVEGPPPRPLELLALRLDDNGFLVVDQDNVIKRGKGPVPRFRPGAT
ncbi:MAG: ubiquinol-cytochrome c reductase iron-sulfur subunit [Desulfobacterales bacterium]|nr:MAG: ubiquinol-cytochrome c reductase iron-sulfur subunit [Desulfobacterales bacterium]